MDDDRVERAARALYEPRHGIPWGDLGTWSQRQWKDRATDVLEAAGPGPELERLRLSNELLLDASNATDDFLEAERGLALAEQRHADVTPWLHRRRLAMHALVARSGGMEAVRYRRVVEELRDQVAALEAELVSLRAERDNLRALLEDVDPMGEHS